jgi:hypothetical protein
MGLLSTIGAASGRAFGFTRSAIAQAVSDAYFNLTTLLLPGNGTNGAQNNTFLDSSSNTFSITRNGNATQGTFSPFSQTGWSNYFNGSSQLTAPSTNGPIQFGTNAFTIEFWMYPTSLARQSILATTAGSGTGPVLAISTTVGAFGAGIYGSPDTINTGGGVIVANKWQHIALVRNSTATNDSFIYVDGVLKATGTLSTNFSTAYAVSIGQNGGGGEYFTGYISNLRVVKGTAVYTAAFTPPTSALTAITNTSLLTCQSNRFIDNSSNAFAITVNGTPSVQAFSPFAPTAAYSAATNGGSGYFDGAGDYIITSLTSTNFNLGAGDFTAECWFYMTGAGITFGRALIGNNAGTTGWSLSSYRTNNGWGLFVTINNSNVVTTTTQPALNAWNHVAFVRSGSSTNNTKIYLNGVQVAQATITTNESNNQAFWVGGFAAAGNDITQGYIASVRYIRGQALTTGDFTPPTAPVTTTAVGWTGSNVASSITGTVSILCNFTNAGITDATSKNVLETVGNAQISTTQSKFGGSSITFDGTGDWLTVIDNPNLQMGSGDFTIEGWFYLSATGVAYGIVSKGTSTTGWSVNITSGNKLQFSYTSSNLTGATTLSSATWYYFAVVRSGTATGNLKVYLNGSADATSAGAVTDNFNQTNIMYIGADRVGGSALNGYIDDLRITKGFARTIATPTSAFPLQ